MPLFYPEMAHNVVVGSSVTVASPVPYLERLLESEADSGIALEQPVTLFVNGREAATFLCTPRNLVEMTVGWLFSEGLIEAASEVEGIGAACPELYRIYVRTDPDRWDERRGLRGLLTTGCGAGGAWEVELTAAVPKVTSELTVSLAQLGQLLREMLHSAEVYKSVGGVHSAALATPEGIVVHYEDVGRHNAVDKCVGRGLIEGLDFSRLILLSTGRISSDMAHKAARAGIPIAASVNSGTSLALQLAEPVGVTIVGKAASHKAMVYCHQWRIRDAETRG